MSLQIKENTIRQIQLARRLELSGQKLFSNSNNLDELCLGILNYHDACELYVLASLQILQISSKEQETLPKLLDKLIEFQTNQTNKLSRVADIRKLNRDRNGIKHHGARPNFDEIQIYSSAVSEFVLSLGNLCEINFEAISLVDLIENEDVRKRLANAEKAMNEGEYLQALIEIAKTIFELFLHPYSIQNYATEPKDSLQKMFATLFVKAPAFAQSHEYYKKNVDEPLDALVIDEPRLERELVGMGISITDFKQAKLNTPEVIEISNPTKKWIVKISSEKNTYTRENARIAFESMLSIAFQMEEFQKRTHVPHGPQPIEYQISPNAQVFESANASSNIVHTVNASATEDIMVQYQTEGFDGNTYFKVYVWEGKLPKAGYVLISDMVANVKLD